VLFVPFFAALFFQAIGQFQPVVAREFLDDAAQLLPVMGKLNED
jgi:hypothetical protein